MNDHDALLAAVIADPDDDGPRLVYADWLEEHGDPDRAKYIRCQVALASMDRDDPRYDELAYQRRRLGDEHGEAWAAAVLVPGVRGVAFQRGFVELVHATAQAFISRGGDWVRMTPLRAVQLEKVAGRSRQLAACAHCSGLISLEVYDNRAGSEDVVAIAESRHLSKLTSLSIQGTSEWGACAEVNDEALGRLGEAAFLPQLASLSITSGGTFGPPGVKSLFGTERTAKLKHLWLRGGAIDDEGALALAAASAAESLEELILLSHLIGNNGFVALVTSPHLPRLTRLSLDGNQVTGAGLAALSGKTCLPGLELISLEGNPIADVDVDALAAVLRANPALRLSLHRCPIPQPVQETLAARFGRRVRVDHITQQRRRPSRVRT